MINTYDAVTAMFPDSGFRFGVGNLILWVNVVMLWVYTLSCHSCRHVVGGRLKHFSKHPVRYWMWTQISRLNTRHKLYAWVTLGTLMLTDFYIMVSRWASRTCRSFHDTPDSPQPQFRKTK